MQRDKAFHLGDNQIGNEKKKKKKFFFKGFYELMIIFNYPEVSCTVPGIPTRTSSLKLLLTIAKIRM